MENVLLIIHLILAVFLIGVVLLQRSEGGALGIGGGGGGAVSSRGATTALAKVTWALAAAFIATSLALTILAAQESGSRSVIDRIEPGAETPASAPLTPPAAEDEAPAGDVAPDLQELLTPAPTPSPPAAEGEGDDAADAPSAPLSPPAAE